MKKIILSVLILSLCVFSIFAYQNTYRLSSDEVQTFLTLRRVSGTITPDPTYPVSGSQLLGLVKSLDSTELTGIYKDMYADLVDELSKEEVLFGGNGSGMDGQVNILGLQLVKSADNTTYNVLPYKDWIPFLDIEGEVFVEDLMYGHFNLNVSHYLENDGINPVDYRKENTVFYTLKDFVFPMPMYLPDNCFMSFGYKNFNFIIGRERLGAGNGFTGNLLFGENSRREDFAKFSFITDNVSYDGTLISYSKRDVWGPDNIAENPKKNIFTHRLSFNIADKVSVTAYEVALLYAKSPFTDLRLFNPAMFLHNTFMYYDFSMNNALGAEITAMLPKGYQLNAQFFLDQICASAIGETVDTGETAYIALANVSKSFEVHNGNLDVYAEGVYGNPYAYLKNSHGHDSSSVKGDISFDAVDFVMDDCTYGSPVDLQYMGYKYGGNLTSIGAGAKYTINGYKFTCDLQFLSKGQYGIRAGEYRKAEGIEDDAHINQNTFMTTLGFEGTFYKGVDVSAKASLLHHSNYHHEKGVSKTDFQLSLGVNIQVLDFFNIRKPL